MKKRAITITTPEVATVFFAIGFLLMVFVIKNLLSMREWALYNGQFNLANSLTVQIFILFFMMFFYLISVSFPVYQIFKNNLFIIIDRLTNPDYMGWFGFNRNKKWYPQIVDIGSFGQTKGVMNDEKADVINYGDYTVTLPNGNQVLIANDLLSTAVDLNNALGWNLINKHYGVFGFKAYELAVKENQVIFDMTDEKKPDVIDEDDVNE